MRGLLHRQQYASKPSMHQTTLFSNLEVVHAIGLETSILPTLCCQKSMDEPLGRWISSRNPIEQPYTLQQSIGAEMSRQQVGLESPVDWYVDLQTTPEKVKAPPLEFIQGTSLTVHTRKHHIILMNILTPSSIFIEEYATKRSVKTLGTKCQRFQICLLN